MSGAKMLPSTSANSGRYFSDSCFAYWSCCLDRLVRGAHIDSKSTYEDMPNFLFSSSMHGGVRRYQSPAMRQRRMVAAFLLWPKLTKLSIFLVRRLLRFALFESTAIEESICSSTDLSNHVRTRTCKSLVQCPTCIKWLIRSFFQWNDALAYEETTVVKTTEQISATLSDTTPKDYGHLFHTNKIWSIFLAPLRGPQFGQIDVWLQIVPLSGKSGELPEAGHYAVAEQRLGSNGMDVQLWRNETVASKSANFP
jgi:hypothetical protein